MSENRKRGIRLKALRVRLGLTQRKLADALGLTHSAISMWESEETEPGIENIVKMAGFFGVTVDYLLCAPGADTPQWVDVGGQRVDYPPEIGAAIKLLSGMRKPVRRSVVAHLAGFAAQMEERIAEAKKRLEEEAITLDESGITEE